MNTVEELKAFARAQLRKGRSLDDVLLAVMNHPFLETLRLRDPYEVRKVAKEVLESVSS